MTEENQQVSAREQRQKLRKRRCLKLGFAFLVCLLLMFIVLLILALTVFKTKQPRVKLLSATMDGVSPAISFPVIKIQLNITLDLQFQVENRNHASFDHGPGKSFLSYRGSQFGEADIPPGNIPVRGSSTFSSRLVLEVDEVASKVSALVNDVLSDKLVLDTSTKIPGRITFLKLFKKHAVVTSDCRFTLDVLAFKIQSQECKSKL